MALNPSPLTAAITTSPLPPMVVAKRAAVIKPAVPPPAPVKPVAANPAVPPSSTPDNTASSPAGSSDQVPDDAFTSASDDLKQAMQQLKALNDPANMPPPPVQQYMPPPPVTAPYDPAQAWGSAAMVIAGLGSLLTRHSMTNAINAAAGVMSAYKQNNANEAANALATWKAQTTNALNLQKYELSEYTDALRAHADSVRDQTAAVTAIASSIKDDVMLQVIQNQGVEGAAPLLFGRAKAASAAAESSQALADYGAKEAEWSQIQKDNKRPKNPAEVPDWSSKMRVKYAEIFGRQQALAGADPTTIPGPDGYSDQEIQALVDNEMGGGGKPVFPSGKAGNFMKQHYNQIMADTILRNSQTSATQPGNLTPDSLDGLAKTYIATGSLPNLGWGKSGASLRTQIINRAFELAKQNNIPGTQFVVNAGNLKANESTLTTLQKLANAAAGFEQTTMDNIKLAQSQMKGIPTDISPLINQWVQTGQIQTGDPDVQAYAAALNTALTEYAKVMSGSTGSVAAVSDSAREEVASLLQKNAPTQVANAVFGVMEQDMQNKERDYAGQIAYVENQMAQGAPSYGYAGYQPPGGAPAAGGAAPAAPETPPVVASQPPAATPPSGSSLHYDAQGNLVP
jgi:hypothetical protein